MKRIKSLDVGTMMVYGAVLFAVWTFFYGFYLWVLGWIFGAQSWFIDMDLVSWTSYTFDTFLTVVWRMIVNGVYGALGGLVVALVYNVVAGIMGGLKVELGD